MHECLWKHPKPYSFGKALTWCTNSPSGGTNRYRNPSWCTKQGSGGTNRYRNPSWCTKQGSGGTKRHLDVPSYARGAVCTTKASKASSVVRQRLSLYGGGGLERSINFREHSKQESLPSNDGRDTCKVLRLCLLLEEEVAGVFYVTLNLEELGFELVNAGGVDYVQRLENLVEAFHFGVVLNHL